MKSFGWGFKLPGVSTSIRAIQLIKHFLEDNYNHPALRIESVKLTYISRFSQTPTQNETIFSREQIYNQKGKLRILDILNDTIQNKETKISITGFFFTVENSSEYSSEKFSFNTFVQESNIPTFSIDGSSNGCSVIKFLITTSLFSITEQSAEKFIKNKYLQIKS